MIIDLEKIDRENFMVHPKMVAGEVCYLIQPQHIAAKWHLHTLCQRSCLVNSKGEVISASFPKFFNWGEHPELTPPPDNLNGAQLVEKIDGSTLIVSLYKGETIIRTRGTSDATALDNGYEIEFLKKKYPKVFTLIPIDVYGTDTASYSVIYEWTSPVNKIVIDYGNEPEIRLIGQINHWDYSLETQDKLDLRALEMNVMRPRVFDYSSVQEMIESVNKLKDQEGLCVYYNNGQSILKVKSAAYLTAHRLKSELGSFERLVDFYFGLDTPSYTEFRDKIQALTDFEVWNQIQGDVSRIATGAKEIEKILDSMRKFVDNVRNDPRKTAAEKIFQAYGKTNRASMAFKILDNKSLSQDDHKKLLYQSVKQ